MLNSEAVTVIARELSHAPIDGRAYAAEAAFLGRLAQHVGAAAGHGDPPLAAQIAVLEALSGQYDANLRLAGNRIFVKNLSILYDDLYVQACLFPHLDDARMRLAEERARFGLLTVDRPPESKGEDGKQRQGSSRMFLQSRRILRYFAAGSLRWAIRQALDFIDPRNLTTPVFPSVIRRWSASQDGPNRLLEFHRRISALVESGGSSEDALDIWTLALSCCGGEAGPALEMLGGIVAQRKGPLRSVQRQGRAAAEIHPRAVEGFSAAARSYFLLGILHERSRRPGGGVRLYPAGIRLESPKFWHFYSAALIGFRLASFPEKVVGRANILISTAYELFTIPTNVRLMASHGIGNAIGHNLHDFRRDVHLHRAGGHFGWISARSSPPRP